MNIDDVALAESLRRLSQPRDDDGSAGPEDCETLARFVAHLPASGWPAGPASGG